MADVYLGYDPHFQRAVAIKIFKQDNDDMLPRFMREAKLMAVLRHPHLMPIYDTGVSEVDGLTRYYIVMPFIDGGTLGMRIRHSALSPEEASGYLLDIATALDYIHQHGIIHRDIKSTNVLLSTDDLCYLSDLGIARLLNDVHTLTSTGNVLGTVDYIAPELFIGNNKADARSDIYSLGVLLFEMVIGQRPFSAENQVALASMHVNDAPPLARTLVPTISPAIEQVLSEALEKEPEQRFPTATAMADAFYRATKMQYSFISASRMSAAAPEQVLDSTIEIPDQLTAKREVQAPITADFRVSAGRQADKKVNQQLTPLPRPIPVRTRGWKRTLTPLLVAVLFAIAVPAAWVLGQMQTAAPSVIIRPADSSIATKTSAAVPGTSKTTMAPKATQGKKSTTPAPSLSSTPAISPTALPSSAPTAGPSQPNSPPVKSAIPPLLPGNLIQDPSYEMQTSSQVASPWTSVGNATIELNSRQARSGENDAHLSPAVDNAWTDISQVVNVTPNTTYTLSVYIHTSGNINANLAIFDAIGVHGSNLTEDHFAASPSGYNLILLTFNSGPYNAVTVRIGFSGVANAWVRADDWYLHS
jgi:serine/threonine protein kinase